MSDALDTPDGPDPPDGRSERLGDDLGDDLGADLARLVGEARAADAVRERAQARSLHEQATAGASLMGLLMDLAEEGAEVTVRMAGGRTHRGRIRVVGRDFVVVRADSPPSSGATEACLATSAISTLRRRPGQRAPDATGDRAAARPIGLISYLAGLAPERPRVTVVVSGEPTALVGELRTVGRDIATMRLDGEPPVTAYVALGSLSEVLVSG